ncbi:amidohydrolase family protein [Gymnodinialimonas ceratoperidinii]|uniref:Amidohydrolase n=1 Tax=Gymnodinialimonas ceratoperidinii TaxID=2856823 RepID=A0A8F6YBI7_9RHOB|nr:amidohydrolase [Gymnodinialimonas ceratoperidinii]QXT40598.1 amidohydrolase [Gymnodinialimonas ceratoperidinii]
MKTLLTNAWIIAVDAAMTEYQRGWLLVEDGTIAAMGEGAAPEAPGAEVRDMGGDIVMPGMVNPHCHMAMSLFRGLGEDVDDRLFRYMLPLERKFVSPEMVRAGSTLSALEMIMGGVTCVADMYYHETEVADVLHHSGMRGVVGQTLADFDPPDHASFDEGFALCDALVAHCEGLPRVTASIAPHAPYSTGRAVLERVVDWHEANPETVIQIHLAETEPEAAWAAETHGMSTTAVCDAAGLLKPGTVAAHCLLVDDADIETLTRTGTGVAHNARSNGKAGRGMARVEDMRRAGIPVGIATDGPMSGNTLDLFSQFGVVSIFAKVLGHSRKPLPTREVIRMATVEGARVLGLDAVTGSLEVGKRADLIRVDISAPRMQPIYDPYSVLVFATKPDDVRDVMVDGRWLMRDRAVETLEQAKVLADANEVAGQFRAEIAAIDAARAAAEG